MEKLKELMKQIDTQVDAFNGDVTKAIDKENKAAARRARLATNALTKLFKDFRKLSVELVG